MEHNVRCNAARLRGTTFVAGALGTLILTACGGAKAPSVQTRPIEAGVVAAEGVSIAAEDGSFTLSAGGTFRPPFQVSCYNWRDEAPMLEATVVSGYRTALAHGARQVRVTVPGRVEPLYGILLLCDVANSATGPASRSYRIDVPQQYVDEAQGGRVSVVYEPIDWVDAYGNSKWWYGWVLWLSDMPIR